MYRPMPPSVPPCSLRPACDGDQGFLFALFSEDKTEELQAGHWDAALRAQVMALQFAAHRQHYRAHCPEAEHFVVLAAGEPVGRLITARRDGALHVMDVALLPTWRGRGLGTWLISACQERAGREGVPLTLHCLRHSRALKLYLRLGFCVAGGDGVQAHLEWRPAASEGSD